MAVKSALTLQEDFTGEYKATPRTKALWRMNDAAPGPLSQLADSAGSLHPLTVSGWDGTSAALNPGPMGRFFRMNITNPATEQTYLKAANDGSFFSSLGSRLAVGGWMAPNSYSITAAYTPVFNTRGGPGQPLIYLSFYQGKPNIMVFNSSGTRIVDWEEPFPGGFAEGEWYFWGAVLDLENKTAQFTIGTRSSGAVWHGQKKTYTGSPNLSCAADIVLGMHSGAYWFVGGLDDWWFEPATEHGIDSLDAYFLSAIQANGGAGEASVDALAHPGSVRLKEAGGEYPASGQLTTAPAECALSGDAKVTVLASVPAGTAIALETSTSNDLIAWSPWALSSGGSLASPNAAWIKYRATLSTADSAASPALEEISLHDLPRQAYESLAYSYPILLTPEGGSWEAKIDGARNAVLAKELNGADTLSFEIPFRHPKAQLLQVERRLQAAGQQYRVRTLEDSRDGKNAPMRLVYAEAAFYDLAYSGKKDPREFNAALPNEAMEYALEGTGWGVGQVTVSTKRTWTSDEKNALAVLRKMQNIHGGDLVFDTQNQLVSLLVTSGRDTGALFAWRKNLSGAKRVTNTQSLVTRLYAYGKDGMDFSSINGGKPYVEDFTYTQEVRSGSLDLSSFVNPYQMLQYAQMRLAEYAKPRVSYTLSVADLSMLSGYSHEAWALGDYVSVYDPELGISLKTRVVRIDYDIFEPWKTQVELSTKLRELGDDANEHVADQLGQASLMQQEIKDLTPFNLLKNSRADNGLSYWISSGFEASADAGASGTACFKAAGELGMAKTLSQTVTPAMSEHYTVSAQFASENLALGPNGQVGIELIFEFEDGTAERRFLDLLSQGELSPAEGE
jgi:phage minor structural protein